MTEVSFSRVQAYQRCPWLYHLVYDEGWRSGPSANAALGQSLHRTLDAFLSKDNDDNSVDRLLELFDQEWVNEGFKNPQETMEAYEKGRKMLEAFHAIDQTRTGEVIATEKVFDVEIEPGVHFKGTVDRLDKNADGSFNVVEYKTHGENWTDERVANDLQMTFYALGLGETLGHAPLKFKYYFLSNAKSAETTRTDRQLEDARQLITGTAKKIQNKDYSPNHDYCARCEFGRRCVNYKGK